MNVEGSPHAASVDTLDPAAIDALLDLLGGDSEALVEVVDAFLEEAPARIAEAVKGCRAGDATLAGRAAHTLKSNALTFGASRLAEQSRSLEEAARNDDLDAAGGMAAALEEEWSRTRPLLCDLRDRNQQ